VVNEDLAALDADNADLIWKFESAASAVYLRDIPRPSIQRFAQKVVRLHGRLGRIPCGQLWLTEKRH
jgi:hypothetical protein